MPEIGKTNSAEQNMTSRISALLFLICSSLSFVIALSGCWEVDEGAKVNRDSLKAARDSANARTKIQL